MDVIGESLGTTTASWSPPGTVRAPTITTPSPPAAAKTGGASPTPPTSTEPEAIASSMGGPEVKSDQLTWNGSVFSRPAALRIASAPVPFWSPTFSVTEDRLTELEGDALPGGAAAAAVAARSAPGGSSLWGAAHRRWRSRRSARPRAPAPGQPAPAPRPRHG